MDQFVYSNIFDTKGIEYIIVISFLLLIIPVWRLLNKPLRQKAAPGESLKAISLDSLRIPEGIFFNSNHTWSFLEKSGVASIGMDDLLLHLTGGVQLEYLKKQEDRVKRGDPLVRITREGKELVISSPISGQLDRVHTALENQSLVNDPYDSWLCRIRPEKWQEESGKALMADDASQWVEQELSRIKDYLAEAESETGNREQVLQEGGELSAGSFMEMGPEVWAGFQRKFLTF